MKALRAIFLFSLLNAFLVFSVVPILLRKGLSKQVSQNLGATEEEKNENEDVPDSEEIYLAAGALNWIVFAETDLPQHWTTLHFYCLKIHPLIPTPPPQSRA